MAIWSEPVDGVSSRSDGYFAQEQFGCWTGHAPGDSNLDGKPLVQRVELAEVQSWLDSQYPPA